MMKPNQLESVVKYQRFQDFTTRKHYAGAHRIGIVINGKVAQEVDFEVLQ